MLKVSQAVENIVKKDPEIYRALGKNYLNLTGYAKEIRNDVENMTLKEVKTGTIVVALSRLMQKLDNKTENKAIKVKGITVKSNLTEVTFERTNNTFKKIKLFNHTIKHDVDDFFVLTQGITEITVIFSKELEKDILKLFSEDPKYISRKLMAVTVKLPKEYIDQQSIFYTLLKALSLNNINIIEIVSTFTELTFILKDEDLGKAVNTLNKYYLAK